jgi:ABC-type branched-subunit amino acid transport system ATPase component
VSTMNADVTRSVIGADAAATYPLLDVRSVSKRFEGLRALTNCSFSVSDGEIVGLIGPNGSGKTTLFNIIAGYMALNSGDITLRGSSISGLRPFQIARCGIGRTFQVTRIFPKMTLIENLLLPAGEGDRRAKATAFLDLVGLADLRNEYANDLSFGQQRLLSIIQVLMLDPSLILLDEPAAGVNPTMQNKITELIKQLNEQGKSFLIVEHNMDMMMSLCKRMVVLNMGEKIAEGTPEDIRRNEAVLAAYFGA